MSPNTSAEVPCKREHPSQDVLCKKLLSSIGYRHGSKRFGVFRDDEHAAAFTNQKIEKDLFSWSTRTTSIPPGPEREALVQPLAVQLLQGMQQLHDRGIVHRDISMETALVDGNESALTLQLAGFGLSSTQRFFSDGPVGRKSYQAPELHAGGYDAFLSDVFALGVTLFCVLVQDYPWLSTKPGGCKCFEFFREHGFRAYLDKRKLRGSGQKLSSRLSEPVVQLLEGLLAFEPDKRLTLGEDAWRSSGGERNSVWEAEWLRGVCRPIPEAFCFVEDTPSIAKRAKVS